MLQIAYTSKKKSFLKATGLCLVAAVVMISTFSIFWDRRAGAADPRNFDAGLIIDDGVFTNSNSMSVGQIQAFLNSKATCAQGATCLKNYMQNPQTGADNYGGAPVPAGAISAAQIIKDYSVQFGINPQVILVTLQKENSLVRSSNPSRTQYAQAMGYGCPDNRAPGAPVCNPSSGNFAAQIYQGARHFRGYFDAPAGWWVTYDTGNNTVPYNPNAGCGSSVVNIRNRATVALYTYTPYQPNPAAIWAGGDGCSAYGNLNFYLIFTDWFGSVRYTFGNTPSNASLYAKQPCTIPGYDTSYVGRLYHPDTKDFLYTTNPTEACVAVGYGYIWDGIAFKNATGPDAIPIYRISNPERHIFTSSLEVRNNHINNYGYRDEGIGFYLYGNNAAGRIPVQGVQKDETFFITSAGREAVYYTSEYGYFNWGTLFYTDTISSDTTPVYRIMRNNARLYTTNPLEKQNAIQHFGFIDEGVVSTNAIGPSDANMPVFRIRNTSGGYAYTTSRFERDAAIVNNGYISEGTAFYGLMYSNAPVYRATNYTNLMRIYTSSGVEYNNAADRYGYVRENAGWYGY